MGKDNSINRETNEIDEFKKTVSRATSEIKTSIGNIENLNRETVQTAQKIQNAGNDIRKATNEIKTIKNDKKGEDAGQKKKATRWSKITWLISTLISIISLGVAIRTYVITRNIGITANDMNMKTQEITYSFSNDLTHNTNIETLNKEFGEYFEHNNLSVNLNLTQVKKASNEINETQEEKESDEINESQMVQLLNAEDDQIMYIGTMFSCYPVNNDICGDVTGVIVSSDVDSKSKDSVNGQILSSKFLSLNEKNTDKTIEQQFVFDDYSVYLIVPKEEDKHLSFMILKGYSEEKTEPIIHTVYVALQGYSGKLRQFAIKVGFMDQYTVFSTIDENDIYDLENVYSFLSYDTEDFYNSESEYDQSLEITSTESTSGDVVNTEEKMFSDLDFEQQQRVMREAQELESKFNTIKDRYEK